MRIVKKPCETWVLRKAEHKAERALMLKTSGIRLRKNSIELMSMTELYEDNVAVERN